MFAISTMYGLMPASVAVLRNVASCILGEHEQMTTPVKPCSLMAFRINACPFSEHIY